MTLYDKVEILKKQAHTYWSDRIVNEIQSAVNESAVQKNKYDALIEQALDSLFSAIEIDGVITASAAKNAEQILMPMSNDLKRRVVHCAAHAHIDMNWMWGLQETVSVTIETFRTVLNLMKEYPDFVFSQSQASTYKIVEDYCPEMLDEIKQRIHEGRWEICASSWVEADKNMPSGESLARQILYTKKYLSELFDVPEESMTIDFEPDTFGHNISQPEILAKGGVKYYYHVRGLLGPVMYNWKARSGESVICYHDSSYTCLVEPYMGNDAPIYCNEYGVDVMLRVYGVGDHGGGPTRRDIERIIDMQSWPIYPTMKFSTYNQFFSELEKSKDKLPVVDHELNFIFAGCFTSEANIKMANRISEARIYEAEVLGTAAHLQGGADYTKRFEKTWRQIMFNQFHDILPGSGIPETRDHAMGAFQEILAAANTNATSAMYTLASKIDTSFVPNEYEKSSISEGGGVGYESGNNRRFALPIAERGLGKVRILHFFNTSQYDFDGVTEIKIWDWQYDINRAIFKDSDGNAAEYTVLDNNVCAYAHYYNRLLIKVKVPALGYATYTLDEMPKESISIHVPDDVAAYDPMVDDDIVLENDKIKAVFESRTMQLISLIDKQSGKTMVDAPACTFRLIHENTTTNISSWRVGKYMKIENLNETQNVRVISRRLYGLKKQVSYEFPFGERSKLRTTVSLSENSSVLEFDVSVDFHEICGDIENTSLAGGVLTDLPQLNFTVPAAFTMHSYRYDIPFATLDRKPQALDVPGHTFAVGVPDSGSTLMLLTDSKYGYRGIDNSISVDLIRATAFPDPYPEYGIHHMKLGVGVVSDLSSQTLYLESDRFNHGVQYVSVRPNESGTLPLTGRLFEVTGARLSAIKGTEAGDGVIVRISDTDGIGGKFSISALQKIKQAYLCDINENVLSELSVSENCAEGEISAYSVLTIKLVF